MKILIADDDLLIVKMLQLCLKQGGHDIIIAMDGLEALEKINEEQPELIILDIMLPFVSGLEIVTDIRSKGNPVPILVASGVEQATIIEEAISAGADKFISKPFNFTELTAYIMQLKQVSMA